LRRAGFEKEYGKVEANQSVSEVISQIPPTSEAPSNPLVRTT
jgi:hypothetical protein